MKYGKTGVLIMMAVLGIAGLWGCPKKAEVSSAPEPAVETAPEQPAEQPAAEAPAEQQATQAVTEEGPKEAAAAGTEGLQPVYFDFDRSAIRSDARPGLQNNAEWLKAHPAAKVRIEGNCDERGTVEYNQALGQRRAQSAKRYLTDLGIASKRISLISYGKEKPVCMESTEECWQKNRRDDFVVVEE
jgi:peptidoglycan-associated lipoprotein